MPSTTNTDHLRARRAAGSFMLALMIASTFGEVRADDATSETPNSLLNEAYRRKNHHDLVGAAITFRVAERAGANAQLVALELGYLAATQGDTEQARSDFERAHTGPDASLSAAAQKEIAALAPPLLAALEPEPARPVLIVEPLEAPRAPEPALAPSEHDHAHALLDQAYQRKAARDYAGATTAFENARAAGANDQLVALELGYIAAARGDRLRARAAFQLATLGHDAQFATEAQRQLSATSEGTSEPARGFWFDLYADAYAWDRVRGANHNADLVPTLRLRGLLRALNKPLLDVYVLAQATRDVASRGASAASPVPVLYADNKLLLGGGVMLRLWDGQLGVYAQLAAALDLVAEDRNPAALDARVGVFSDLHMSSCWPDAASGSELRAWWCNELYADASYINRFDNNIVAFARGRSMLGYARTGPVAWQLALEGRAAKDRNNDYYNNFADVGIGPLWRVLAPPRFDFMVGVHAGSYFGLKNRDPAPDPLGYVDLRAVIATYWSAGP